MYSEPSEPYPGPPPEGRSRPTEPEQTSTKKPHYYMPPYYPIPTRVRGPPIKKVDRLMASVPFSQRPLALTIAIGLLIVGVVICLGFLMFVFNRSSWFYSTMTTIVTISFLFISILGIISMVLLLIPKKLGWYFAVITGIVALPLFPGTFIGIFTIVALMWPSVRFYFHTGQYPPLMHMTTPTLEQYPDADTQPQPQSQQPYPPQPYHTYAMPKVRFRRDQGAKRKGAR
jgi:hypothetical protein